MEPIAAFSGLASGIDTASLVDALVRIERQPIIRLETKQNDLNSISNRLNEIKNRLDSLQGFAEGLDTRPDILSSAASSNNESRLGVSATGDAALGSYEVEITSLARAERTYSDGVSARDQDGLFGSGTLSIQVGTAAAVDITVNATDTLDDVAAAINSSDAEVSAAVIFDGTDYRLQVAGQNTGAENAITFTETGTTLGLDDPANELVAAADAAFTIDGLAMTRSNNQITDAVAGVTLDLVAETDVGETVQINVTRDTEGLTTSVQEFVDGFNNVVNAINSEFAFLGAARTGDSLSGDSTLRTLQSRLANAVVDPITGLSEPYNRLQALGITLTNTGTLELDENVLTAAVADDPDAVADFFAGDQAAGVVGFMERLATEIDLFTQTGDGLISTRIDGISDSISDIDDRIADMELRVEKFEEITRSKFAAMEALVSGLNAQGAQLTSILGGGQ